MRQKIQRFNGAERFLHWLIALLFLVLLVTGLVQHLNVLREWVGSGRYGVRMVHHYAGLALMTVPWVLIVVKRRELATFFDEMTKWREVEVDYIYRQTKLAHKFNGGQKLNFLVAMLLMLGLAGTGLLVWQSQWISVDTREFLYAWHKLLFYLFTIQIAGHVFYAAIYKPTRHALQGMLHGRVDRDWALRHHPLWQEEEQQEER